MSRDKYLTRAGFLTSAIIATLICQPSPASAYTQAVSSALQWQACKDAPGFDCATAHPPLDYANPDGKKIDLAVIRHAATDQANRIGTLFFNPGGPGGSGTEDLPQFLDLFPAAVRARFDIVSWDPRGVGAKHRHAVLPHPGRRGHVLPGRPDRRLSCRPRRTDGMVFALRGVRRYLPEAERGLAVTYVDDGYRPRPGFTARGRR